MRRAISIIAAGALLLGAVGAQASDATIVADRAGFLLGHAQRCGVDEGRLLQSRAFMDELIAAFAADDDDLDAAKAQFTQRILASALAELIGDPLPGCGEVRSHLVELDRHHPPSDQLREEKEMAQSNRPAGKMRRTGSAAAKPAASRKPATTRREDISPDRRAELELRRAAQQLRGRPPSI